MKLTRYVTALAAVLLAIGCASVSNLPTGAKKVGGGLQIDWDPPGDGTAILVEVTTGRIVATASVDESGKDFEFDVTSERDAETLKALFPTMPPNAQFVLYFVPSPKSD